MRLRKNRLGTKYGHTCDINLDKDAIYKLIERPTRWMSFKRYVYQRITISEHNTQMKRYGRSQKLINQDKELHLYNHPLIIHPCSDARIAWNFLMIITLVTFYMSYPYCVAFNLLCEWPWYTFYMLQLIVFWMDIILNFNTGYRNPRTNIVYMDRKNIIKNYLQGFFLIDILSSIPVTLISHLPNVTSSHFVRYVSMGLGTLKLLKFINIREYKMQLQDILKLNVTKLSLIELPLKFLICIHTMACLGYGIRCEILQESNPSSTCIIPSTILPTETDVKRRMRRDMFHPFRNATRIYWLSDSYSKSFYDASLLFTKTATGFTYFYTSDVVFCLVMWLISELFAIFYVGSIMKIFLGSQSSKSKYQEMIRILRDYMHNKQLPPTLQKRLLKYYEFRFQKSYFCEAEILDTISGQLRQELVCHSCRKLVENVTLFSNLPLAVLVRIVSCLRSEVYLTNDIVIRANTPGDAMYFIASGTVAIYTQNGKEICHLEDGAHFGEVALVMREEKRVASVVAVENCELYKLNRQDFIRAVLPYPELLEYIERTAMDRFERAKMIEAKNTEMYIENYI